MPKIGQNIFKIGQIMHKVYVMCENTPTHVQMLTSHITYRGVSSVPFKALWRTIGSSPWKIGSTDFVTMCKKDAFSW